MMSQPQGTRLLKLTTLNINGGHTKPDKLSVLLQHVTARKLTFVALQETHHADESEALGWMRAGTGRGHPAKCCSYWKAGTTASRGVGILYYPHPDVRDVRVHEYSLSPDLMQHEGRALRVDYKYCGHPCSLINVYAPSTPEDRVRFYTHVLLPLMPQGRRLIITGDFMLRYVLSSQSLSK